MPASTALAQHCKRAAQPSTPDGCAAKAAPYQDLYYLSTATHGDGIYLLEAFSPVFASAQKYNAQTDVWTSVRRIPTSRTAGTDSATAVTVESGIYVSGGYWASFDSARRFEMYYPVVDIWTTKRDLPTGGGSRAGGAWGSTVMLAGGFPYSNQFHRYSAVTDTWTSGECLLRLAPSVAICMRLPAHTVYVACVGIRAFAGLKLPTGVDHTSGVVKGNYFYVVGGAINYLVAQSTVYVYDCNAGTWAAGKRTPARAGA